MRRDIRRQLFPGVRITGTHVQRIARPEKRIMMNGEGEAGKHRAMAEKRTTENQKDIREAKKQLRRRMREQMRSLPADYVRAAGEDIQKQILTSARYREAGSIFLFVSMPKETPTDRILRQALADGKKVCVPKCSAKEMQAVRIRDLKHLYPGMLGILEPSDCSETMAAEELDLILVPCLAAAPDGRRLGHGGGYYDRFLEGHTENAVCLCFRRMFCDEIPMDRYDVLMPCVVSERETADAGQQAETEEDREGRQ